MEFLFTVTGGDLGPLFGSQGGIILNLGNNSSFNGTFVNDFENGGIGLGNSDTASVPDAGGTVILLGFGLAVLAFAQRSIRHRYERPR